MKQLFRCEYCNETGAEEIQDMQCLWNYKRTCYTCNMLLKSKYCAPVENLMEVWKVLRV